MTETQAMQPFDWNLYSNFSRIGNVIAFCMKFKRRIRDHAKQTKAFKQIKYCFDFFHMENFQNVSTLVETSKEISKNLNVAKLSNFIEQDVSIRVKGRLKVSWVLWRENEVKLPNKFSSAMGQLKSPITTPAERRNVKKVISTYHRNKCQRRIGLQT